MVLLVRACVFYLGNFIFWAPCFRGDPEVGPEPGAAFGRQPDDEQVHACGPIQPGGGAAAGALRRGLMSRGREGRGGGAGNAETPSGTGLRQVHLAGLEPATFGSVDRCSIQLSYRCKGLIAKDLSTSSEDQVIYGWRP
jgi:hypothetical protein